MQFNFIDICYPDYLTDHHNRDNEQLVAVPWCEDMTDRELIEEIVDAVYNSSNDEIWKHLPKDEEQCRVSLIQTVTDEIIGMDLSIDSVDEPDEMYIYCYFSW